MRFVDWKKEIRRSEEEEKVCQRVLFSYPTRLRFFLHQNELAIKLSNPPRKNHTNVAQRLRHQHHT